MGKEKKNSFFKRRACNEDEENVSTSSVIELEQKILHLQPKNL